jgi:hypothetical protein
LRYKSERYEINEVVLSIVSSSEIKEEGEGEKEEKWNGTKRRKRQKMTDERYR